MTTYELIRDAILNKKQVIATYSEYRREMTPHVLGLKKGRRQCLFYQFGGDTSKGSVTPGSEQNWRCIPIEFLKDIKIQDGPWHTANNHSQRQTCIDEIDVQVSYK